MDHNNSTHRHIKYWQDSAAMWHEYAVREESEGNMIAASMCQQMAASAASDARESLLSFIARGW